MKKYWFVFCKTDLMIERLPDGSYTIPCQDESPVPIKEWITVHKVSLPSRLQSNDSCDTECRAFNIPFPITDKEHYEMCPLRASYHKLPLDLYLMAGKCQEILYWDTNTRYCGVCGGTMKLHTDISKRCIECGKEIWPQLATAVIVLITRIENGVEKVLLVQSKSFKSNYYGLVAGFVETGETLEEAVRREVKEEVGYEIKGLRYYGSQPWPYPCGLMVGFFAEYAGGKFNLQHSELGRGGWFTRDNLPPIPEKLSIARKLLDTWINEDKKL